MKDERLKMKVVSGVEGEREGKRKKKKERRKKRKERIKDDA
jgi:hypothetical protein